MATSILVVDDAHLERVLVEGLLRTNPNYTVTVAEDGREALANIAAEPPDLVVTDLCMPEMNGLELVRHIRQHHREIPVILMTAYGDESTAVEALEAGAASYVPKAQRAERLMSTVDRVLEHAAANRGRERLAQSMLEYHCRFALENDLRVIRAVVNEVQHVMASMELADTVERIRMGEAFEEALLNAMYHGNLEISTHELDKVRGELDDCLLTQLIEDRCGDPQVRTRRILVVIHVSAKEVRFVIRDEGKGFDELFLENATDEHRFAEGRHRGITLIRSLMDEVTYNTAGNELVLRKRLLAEETQTSGV